MNSVEAVGSIIEVEVEVEVEIEVDEAPDAVRRTRRAVARALAGSPWSPRSDDAQLVVVELVTNALLHARPPVVVRLQPAAVSTLRIEVYDASVVAPPTFRTSAAEGMTGRGLTLVEGVSDRWGVSRRGSGKIVWVELDAERSVAWPPGPSASDPSASDPTVSDVPVSDVPVPRLRVRLGDVSTSLLLAAKSHVDNLVREFTLASAGAATGTSARVPPHLAKLIIGVTTEFAEARQAIRNQALAAASAGRDRTSLVLELPATAAGAGLRYLEALDRADTYARAARLLTLETPVPYRAFRHWYVTSLVAQLTAAAEDKTPPAVPTFEDYLLRELRCAAAGATTADGLCDRMLAALERDAGHDDDMALLAVVFPREAS